jgi:hypothetical protein
LERRSLVDEAEILKMRFEVLAFGIWLAALGTTPQLHPLLRAVCVDISTEQKLQMHTRVGSLTLCHYSAVDYKQSRFLELQSNRSLVEKPARETHPLEDRQVHLWSGKFEIFLKAR